MEATAIVRRIGSQVRQQRASLGITQKQLANNAGVSERLVRSLEMGLANGIGLEKLAAILSSLDLTMAIVNDSNDATEIRLSAITHDNEYSEALAQAMASWKPEALGEEPA